MKFKCMTHGLVDTVNIGNYSVMCKKCYDEELEKFWKKAHETGVIYRPYAPLQVPETLFSMGTKSNDNEKKDK